MRKLEVQKYIQEQNEKIQDDSIADIVEVKQFWTNVLREECAEVKDRLKASEFIAKTNGAFLDRVETNVSVASTDKLDDILSQIKD